MHFHFKKTNKNPNADDFARRWDVTRASGVEFHFPGGISSVWILSRISRVSILFFRHPKSDQI